MQAYGLNPRIHKSPFSSSSLKYGATEFHPYNGMRMPVDAQRREQYLTRSQLLRQRFRHTKGR